MDIYLCMHNHSTKIGGKSLNRVGLLSIFYTNYYKNEPI